MHRVPLSLVCGSHMAQPGPPGAPPGRDGQGGRDRHNSPTVPFVSAVAAGGQTVPLQTVQKQHKGLVLSTMVFRQGRFHRPNWRRHFYKKQTSDLSGVPSCLWAESLSTRYLTSLPLLLSHPKGLLFKITFSYAHFNRYLNAFCEHYPVKQTPII